MNTGFTKLTALSLGFVLSGCLQATEPRSAVSSRHHDSTKAYAAHELGSAHSLHVEAKVEVIPRVFVSGSEIEITVSARNTGKEIQYIPSCPITFILLDKTGNDMGTYPTCGFMVDFIALAPGDEIERKFTQPADWPPGRYQVYPFVGSLPLQHPVAVRILAAEGGPTP